MIDTNLIDRLKGHAEYFRHEAGEQLYSDLQQAIRHLGLIVQIDSLNIDLAVACLEGEGWTPEAAAISSWLREVNIP